MRDLVPRLRLWARLHPARAWICGFSLVALVWLLVGIIIGDDTTG